MGAKLGAQYPDKTGQGDMIGTAVGAIILLLVCGIGSWMAMNSLETPDSFGIDVLDVAAMARDTFQTPAEADGWMRAAHPLLDGQSPLKASQTKAGAKRVSEILTVMKWGGVV